MMIAQRFKAAGWLAGVASAGIGLYLISLQVAAERGRLERVERQIVATRGEIRMLQTEFGARASMRQLEKWNGEVLALSTPKAVQFLRGQVQLASFDPGLLDPNRPKVVMASAAKPAPAKPPVVVPAPGTASVRYATYTRPDEAPTVTKTATMETPALLRKASLTTGAQAPIKSTKEARPVAAVKTPRRVSPTTPRTNSTTVTAKTISTKAAVAAKKSDAAPTKGAASSKKRAGTVEQAATKPSQRPAVTSTAVIKVDKRIAAVKKTEPKR